MAPAGVCVSAFRVLDGVLLLSYFVLTVIKRLEGSRVCQQHLVEWMESCFLVWFCGEAQQQVCVFGALWVDSFDFSDSFFFSVHICHPVRICSKRPTNQSFHWTNTGAKDSANFMTYVVGLSNWLVGNIKMIKPIKHFLVLNSSQFFFLFKWLVIFEYSVFSLSRSLYSSLVYSLFYDLGQKRPFYKYQNVWVWAQKQNKTWKPMKMTETESADFPPKRTLRPTSVIRHPLPFGKQPCDCVLNQLSTLQVSLIISYSTDALGMKCDSRDSGTWPTIHWLTVVKTCWLAVCSLGGTLSEVRERVRESERPEWASLVLPDLPGVKV